jgi:hypothetical protein
MLWAIILDYAIKGISVDELTAKEGLLLWVQKKTKVGRRPPDSLLRQPAHVPALPGIQPRRPSRRPELLHQLEERHGALRADPPPPVCAPRAPHWLGG